MLSRTFLSNYSPSQELSVDEAMIKYKGHIRGKVCMPNKPIKAGFKVWCCSICYYAFEDRSRVCFVSNVFPEAMETQVVRVQLDRTLQFQSIPPLLPAYNKYMGGVDRLSQVRKTYGFDRKSKRYWIRPFFIIPLIMPTYCTNTIASCLICLPKSC